MSLEHDKWDCVKVMRKGLEHKFTIRELKTKLLATTPLKLVHSNPHDLYWANGLSLRDARLADTSSWKGKNKLGEILVQLRDTL